MTKPASHLVSRTAKFLAVLIAAGLTFPAIARDKRPDNLVPAGPAVDCIQPSNIRSTNVRDDRTIDFEMNGGKIYRNTLPNSCPSLGFEKRFLYRLSTSQLCSVDMIRVLQSFGGGLQEGAACGLGKFQPMTKTK
jgi:hypothetical protein